MFKGYLGSKMDSLTKLDYLFLFCYNALGNGMNPFFSLISVKIDETRFSSSGRKPSL